MTAVAPTADTAFLLDTSRRRNWHDLDSGRHRCATFALNASTGYYECIHNHVIPVASADDAKRRVEARGR